MFRQLKFISIFILISSCSSPTGYWIRKEASNDKNNEDKYICLQETKVLITKHNYVSQFTPPHSNPITPSQRAANSFAQGVHQGAQSRDSTYLDFDDTLFEACMRAKGFEYHYEKPENISQEKWNAYLKRTNRLL
jgi:hypothetical protein